MTTRPIVLYTPYFKAKTLERQKEIDLCIQKNIQNPLISSVILLADNYSEVPFTHEKVSVEYVNYTPTYDDWLQRANSKVDTIAILCNSDIYFDESIQLVHEVLQTPDTFLCLTRYDVKVTGDIVLYADSHWSQDVWAYSTSSKILNSKLCQNFQVPLGKPRCDNKIAYLFAINGWKIVNACKFIRSYHVHETQERTYDKQLDNTIIGGVAYVHPCKTLTGVSDIEITVWIDKTVSPILSVNTCNALENWRSTQSTPITPISSTTNTLAVNLKQQSQPQAVKTIHQIDRRVLQQLRPIKR